MPGLGLATLDTKVHQRRRVLVSAFAVSPYRGSEQAVGWSITTRLARYHDVTVLCAPYIDGHEREDFRAEIEQYRSRHGLPAGLRFEFVEPPLLCRAFQRECQPWRSSVYYMGYAAWQRAALRVARRLHEQQPFDLVHHLNIIGYREPGYLWKLDVPFVWGPVAGASNFPWRYFGLLSPGAKCTYGARNLANAVQQRFLRRPMRAARSASVVWTVGRENAELVRRWGVNSEMLLEVGTDPQPRLRQPYDGGRPLRLAWSGTHTGGKAMPLLIRAMAKIPGVRPELVVLGDGPETSAWQKLAVQLGVAQQIRWSGQMARADAIAQVSSTDAFVFTSLQEATSTVVLEALSMGVPVVCHDTCGMAAAVNESCGIKVPVSTPNASVAGFAEAICRLRDNPQLLAQLGDGALERSAELSWDRNVARIAAGYERVWQQVPMLAATEGR